MDEDLWQTLAAQRRRAVFAVLAFGAVLCCAAYFIVHHLGTEIERQLLNDLASSQARQLGETFGSDEDDPGRGEGKRQILADLAVRTRDHFVSVALLDERGRTMSRTTLPSFLGIERRVAGCSENGTDDGRAGCEIDDRDGARFLLVRVPFGANTGWTFEGLYRADAETVGLVKSVYAAVVGLVVVSLILAILLMYPVVRFLQRNLTRTFRRLLEANLEMLKALGCATAKRDSDTADHNFRVTLYAVRIAEKMGLSDRDIRGLIKGALLHDVGKIAVRDAILRKPGKLTEAEFAEMRQHVAHGLEIIAADAWLADARDVVACHHEKFDGSGYPRGLSGKDIPLTARVFAVADVFDALVSRRPYKPPISVDKALEIMEQGRGSHFDAKVLDAFLGVIDDVAAVSRESDGTLAQSRTEDLLRRYFRVGAPPA
jgi:HD-GYP domain-containing protein (c-di-GMP phosphodiesterase class II)